MAKKVDEKIKERMLKKGTLITVPAYKIFKEASSPLNQITYILYNNKVYTQKNSHYAENNQYKWADDYTEITEEETKQVILDEYYKVKRKVYISKVTEKGIKATSIYPQELLNDIRAMEHGDKYYIKCVEMTLYEVNKLKEFEGF